MSAISASAKVQAVGIAGGILSVVVLVFGLAAGGGGHGSYTIWYIGLAAATLSALLVIIAGIWSAAKKSERKNLPLCVLAALAFIVVALKFFAIVDWFSEIIPK
jgi:hypothetical protein